MIKKLVCIWCQNVFRSSGGTSNLLSHLKSIHKLSPPNNKNDSSDCESCDDSRGTSDEEYSRGVSLKSLFKKRKLGPIEEAFSKIKSFKNGENAGNLTNSILYMIAVDQLPFTIVENRGFKQLMKLLAPLYELRGAKSFTMLMDERYDTLKRKMVLKLSTGVAFSLTCDNWTDIKNQTYLGVTGHFLMPNFDVLNINIGCFPMEDSHTAVNLRLAFQNVLKEFELKESKLMYVTSDQAANISKELREAVGENKHLGCFAHDLSHLVPDALNNNTDLDMEKLRDTIDKVRAIVKFVKKSTLVSGELKRLQMILENKPESQCLKLKKDMAIRWNSTLFMIERFLQLEQHLPMSLKASEAKSKPSMLYQEELDILRDAVSIMQPVGFAITDISGNKYPTVSLVIPLINCMRKEISLIEPHTICGKKFKTNLQQQMEHRFKNIESNILMTVATLLDPRFKDAHFQLNMTIVNTKNQLKKIINSTSASTDPVIVQNAGKTCSSNTQKSLWSHHAAIITSRNTKNASYNDFDNQISNYLKEPLLNPEENPLEAWKTLQYSFPQLCPVAIRYLCVQDNSVSSERLFSKAGDIVTLQRSRLQGKRVNKLIFLSSLSHEQWFS